MSGYDINDFAMHHMILGFIGFFIFIFGLMVLDVLL